MQGDGTEMLKMLMLRNVSRILKIIGYIPQSLSDHSYYVIKYSIS